jgi:hypothetical protein
MTVTIELPPDIEASILAQVEAEGLPVREYLQNLLKRHLSARIGQSKAHEHCILFDSDIGRAAA